MAISGANVYVRTLAHAILYGSSIRPACFALRRDVEEGHSRCPYCNVLKADHAHVFWQCPERPPDLQRFSTSDIVQARLGWPLGPDDPIGIAVLKQMTTILEDIWTARHAFQPINAGSWQSDSFYRPHGFSLQLRPTGRRRQRQSNRVQHEQS